MVKNVEDGTFTENLKHPAHQPLLPAPSWAKTWNSSLHLKPSQRSLKVSTASVCHVFTGTWGPQGASRRGYKNTAKVAERESQVYTSSKMNVPHREPTFSLSSFTFIKRLFSSSLLSAIRVVSSAYLRLLMFLLAIFTPACASSSLEFHMMYSTYKLNKQGHNMQPWHPPFPIWNQSVVPCPVLTVASWPAYKFLRRQIR